MKVHRPTYALMCHCPDDWARDFIVNLCNSMDPSPCAT